MTEPEKAYLAGIFDGEGSIVVHRACGHHRLNHNFTPKLSLQMTDEVTVCSFAEAWGGHTRKVASRNLRYKDLFAWEATSNALLKCLSDLIPYLKIKLRQARLALELQQRRQQRLHIKSGQRGAGLSVEEIAYRQGVKNQITTLNRTGKSSVQ